MRVDDKPGGGENRDVFVVFLSLIEVRATSDGIRFAHGRAGFMVEREMIVL